MDVTAVDATNAEQLRAWDGEEGTYWAAHADRFDRAVAPYHGRLMSAASISAGERVLDIGCGTGQTTRDAARAAAPGDGSALGVDLSSRMLEVARARAVAEGVDNIAFEQADAQVHPFDAASFDVAISRTGSMFFGDPLTAFTNIKRALRPGGRMVLIAWQSPAENEWIREIVGALTGGWADTPPADAPGPFSLSDPGRVHALLGAAGFVDVELTGVSAPEWFGADAADAHAFVLGLMDWMLRDLDHDARARAVGALQATMAHHEGAEGVTFASAAWVITATRRA